MVNYSCILQLMVLSPSDEKPLRSRNGYVPSGPLLKDVESA